MADVSSIMIERPVAPTRQRLNGRIAALLATTALVATAALLPGAACALDATWLTFAFNGDFNNNANWNPATVPTDIAFFGTSIFPSLTFSAPSTSIGGWTFNSGASAY